MLRPERAAAFIGRTLADFYRSHCRSPLRREIFSLFGFWPPWCLLLFLTNVGGPGGGSCAIFRQPSGEGSQLIWRVVTFALDPERVADQIGLCRRREMVQMKTTFIVAVLGHAAKGELLLRIGPAANGLASSEDNQEAFSICVDVASLALDSPSAATVAPEGAWRGVKAPQ